jgi:hypothetical protein
MPPKQNQGGNRGLAAPQFLNLERVPNLAPKFANKLGKTAEGYSLKFDMEGFRVVVDSLLNDQGESIDDSEEVSLLEFERRVALANAPSNEERLSALKRKYELRLNRAFPDAGPASGAEPSIATWLATLPFAERRALLMSQKDFNKSYPEGFRP